MKLILPKIENEKKKLPKGKLNVRFRQMRAHYQGFAGNKYLTGADGETAEKAIEQLHKLFEVPQGSEIKVN